MSRLILVRHGDTKSNSADRFWGQTDVRLSDSGIKQAEQLRDRLSTEKIDAIYSSNLCRASETARIIAASHQLGIVTCNELREINFGNVSQGCLIPLCLHSPDEIVRLFLVSRRRLMGFLDLLVCSFEFLRHFLLACAGFADKQITAGKSIGPIRSQ